MLTLVLSRGETMRIRTIAAAVAMAAAGSTAWAAAAPVQSDAQIAARVAKVLSATPLIDGHNDLPDRKSVV